MAAFAAAILVISWRVPDLHPDRIAESVLAEFGMHGHLTIRDTAFDPVADVAGHALRPPRMYRLHAEEGLWPEELAAANTKLDESFAKAKEDLAEGGPTIFDAIALGRPAPIVASALSSSTVLGMRAG